MPGRARENSYIFSGVRTSWLGVGIQIGFIVHARKRMEKNMEIITSICLGF